VCYGERFVCEGGGSRTSLRKGYLVNPANVGILGMDLYSVVLERCPGELWRCKILRVVCWLRLGRLDAINLLGVVDEEPGFGFQQQGETSQMRAIGATGN